jgi:hypothetical protein
MSPGGSSGREAQAACCRLSTHSANSTRLLGRGRGARAAGGAQRRCGCGVAICPARQTRGSGKAHLGSEGRSKVREERGSRHTQRRCADEVGGGGGDEQTVCCWRLEG